MRTWLAVCSLALLLTACPPPKDNVVVPAHTGDVPPPPTAGAEGAACDTADQCASGVCEGQGCSAGGGRCAASDRRCTRDHVAYCGCDGKTFHASGSCPGARYSVKGACVSEASDEPPPPPPPPAPAADGAACTAHGDCASGICEGQGCDPGQGVCAAKSRKCTRDFVAFCGCGGVTFKGSSSCPGDRYSAKGACPTK